MTPTESSLSKKIKAKALELGFSACGITNTDYLKKDADYLKQWLIDGKHAEMNYLSNHFEKRLNPSLMVENSKSVICVAMNYFPQRKQNAQTHYKISKYAYGKDYHKVLKKRLGFLLDFIKTETPKINARIFVDSAPVLERSLAAKAGLGWIGKNTMLINPNFGSFSFLGEIICDLELEFDQPINDHCGRCVACLKACPTNALCDENPYRMNAGECISYHTIESKDFSRATFPKSNKNWIFGCDICQDVCPWNKKSVSTTEIDFAIRDFIASASNEDWENLTAESFLNEFNGNPIMRSKFEGLKGNISKVKQNKFTS